jgi:hypothetical protein
MINKSIYTQFYMIQMYVVLMQKALAKFLSPQEGSLQMSPYSRFSRYWFLRLEVC